MALAVKKIKVYGKLIAIGAVVLAVLLIVLMNWNHRTDVWFFYRFEQVPVLWLIAVTAAGSVVAWTVLRRVVRVIRELREVRANEAIAQQQELHRRQAEELAERERRIDAKLQRSLSDPGNGPPTA